jgi:manganese/zinc/iron transport system permease protein
MYELSEPRLTHRPHDGVETVAVPVDSLLEERSWSQAQLETLLHRAAREELLVRQGDRVALTRKGWSAAWRVTRNHRLWELFLIQHADIAPSHVDRDADQVEHVLDPALIDQLEAALADEHPDLAAPVSPHRLTVNGGGAA